MKIKTVAFHTLGCKVNSYETEVMMAAFLRHGAQVVPFSATAEVYIVNTCTVTHISDRKSRQLLRQAKRQNPLATVVAVGCYAQVAEAELLSIPEIDLVIGNVGKSHIVERVVAFLEMQSAPTVEKIEEIHTFEPMAAEGSGRTRAVMKIEDGCNNFCTYCIIPYARGRVRSKPLVDCVEEFTHLCQQGFLEIVLTGIEIALYGKDLGCTLLSLLEAVAPVAKAYPGLRVRLGSLEPRLITPGFVAAIATMDFLCPHFHLSLQSGSDDVLRRMGRRYTTSEYGAACALLKQYFPHVSLTTDIIVGFPGETEAEFLETAAFVRKIGFLKVHIFPYSRRSGTPAADMSPQVAKPLMTERCRRLAAISDEVGLLYLESQRGNRFPVLLEAKREGTYSGHTPNYLELSLQSDEDLRGKIVELVVE